MESLDFKALGYGTISKEMLDRIVGPVSTFLMQRTKQELFEGAIKRRVLLFPVATFGDILANPQLEARKFFQTVERPGTDGPLTTLGPFVRASATPLESNPAPRLGQHNEEIYVKELGLTRPDFERLHQAGVI
jgi:crotonobetainyl-CoA:carnitine CoA-transferase CaiB-like acyl-CoA transferase